MMFTPYFLLVCTISGAGALTPLTVVKQWPGGFEASFTVQAHQRLKGWIAHIRFNGQVEAVQVWKGRVIRVHNDTKPEYVIQNKSFDGQLQPGQDLIVEIQAYTDVQMDKPGSYYIEGFNGTSEVPIVNPTQTIDGSSMKYDYKEALRLSILFYDGQRSGHLPPNNPIPWREDAHVNDSDNGHDLSGGWYDAGDHLKVTLPLAQAVTMLELGFLRFRSGYDAADQTAMMCDMIKWPLDYMLKLWLPDTQTLYVQVGSSSEDHSYWGRPENMDRPRPAYKVNATCPGSDVAASMVSALAAGSMVFDEICSDANYSATLKQAAKSLYKFATDHRGLYQNCLGRVLYSTADDRDELSTASAWMYKVFHDDHYLTQARAYDTDGTVWSLSWHDQGPETDLLLYEITQEDKYKSAVINFIDEWMPGGSLPHTPCGLTFRDRWGSLRYAANVAFLALVAADDGLYPEEYKTWALSQINYILGDNKYNMSYEIAFGEKYPLNYHHRGSACPTNTVDCTSMLPGNNKNLLKGGVVGGPDIHDNYTDNRNWYTQTEVDIGYNSGFQGALAGFEFIGVLRRFQLSGSYRGGWSTYPWIPVVSQTSTTTTPIPSLQLLAHLGFLHFALKDELPEAPTPLC